MDVQIASATSRFSDRVLRFLERVEHRVAKTPAEREAAYRLRYEAYIREGRIEPRADRRLHEERYDDAPNCRIMTTFIEGELAGTTRVHVASDESAVLPSLAAFSDLIAPHLHLGRVMTDFTRTAARLEFSKHFPELPYVILRPAFLASAYFDADFAIAMARAERVAFFRRVFCFAPWCEPRDYPDFMAKVACMGADFRAVHERIEARYPFFRSTAAEREALFGSLGDAAVDLSQAMSGRRRFETQASAAP
jgi:hypothetical protein